MPRLPLPSLSDSLFLIQDSRWPPGWARLGFTHCSPSNYVLTPGGWFVSPAPDGRVHGGEDGVCVWPQEGALKISKHDACC